MAQTPDQMAATMIVNMREKTGKTLPQWLRVTKASKLTKHGQIVKHRKREYGVTHGFANLIDHETFKTAGDATHTTRQDNNRQIPRCGSEETSTQLGGARFVALRRTVGLIAVFLLYEFWEHGCRYVLGQRSAEGPTCLSPLAICCHARPVACDFGIVVS